MPIPILPEGIKYERIILPGTKVEVTGPRPPWAKNVKAKGELVQVTDHLYIICLPEGFCECFIRCDPSVSIRLF